jgi:hypothetical protein
MILGTMVVASSGCLSPAPPHGAENEIDEVQSATQLDETAATDPAQVAAEAATSAASHGPLPFDPCPCNLPICRPGCTRPAIVLKIAPPPPVPPPLDPCPCDNPVCRPLCKNP